ncbi:MAG: hypothetical protein KDC11_05035 [Chitinophagaceae bacterium]|nr:hypothetical protein [Chitinophagaceae bacterium]
MNIHDIRETDKLGLEMFNLNKENKFDNAIDKLVVDLQKQINDLDRGFRGINELMEDDPIRYSELVEEAERYEISIDHQQYETILDMQYYQEELQSIVEMKIINAFKTVEIDIKILVGAAFQNSNQKRLYKWESILSFFKSKNIDVTNFKSYDCVNQIRQVNNAIKHSGDYEKSLTSIIEFSSDKKPLSDRLLDFYDRVKKMPEVFIDELSTAIYNELYEFNDEKIDDIAQSFVLRMNKGDAEKLTSKILSFYN